MAQGNMFRKQRSVSRAANPMGQNSAKSQFLKAEMNAGGSLFYPQGSQRPNLQTSPQRSMVPNPIAPAVAEVQANAAFMRGNPGFGTSSLDATQRFNGLTANNAFQSSMVNGYVGQAPVSSPFDEHASRARAQEYMRGGPAADPTNLAGRFGGAPVVSQESRDAQARTARGQASDQLLRSLVSPIQGVGMSPQMFNRKDPTYEGPFAKQQADGGVAYTNREGAFLDAFTGLANPATRDATLQSLMETNPEDFRAYQADQQDLLQKRQMTDARAQKFKDEHGGMSARQFGIQSRQDKRETARYRKAIMQGLNPMSPQAQALFPEQTKSFMEQRQANRGGAVQGGGQPVQNPMAAPERTMAGQQQSAQRVAELAATSPAIAGLGVKPEQGMIGLHTALGQRLDEDPNLNLSDDELRAYQQYAMEMSNLSTDQNNQFDFGGTPFDKYSGELWKELAGLPDNQRAREDWLKKYKGRNNAATGAATATPPAGTYFMGGPVGR